MRYPSANGKGEHPDHMMQLRIPMRFFSTEQETPLWTTWEKGHWSNREGPDKSVHPRSPNRVFSIRWYVLQYNWFFTREWRPWPDSPNCAVRFDASLTAYATRAIFSRCVNMLRFRLVHFRCTRRNWVFADCEGSGEPGYLRNHTMVFAICLKYRCLL